MANPKKGPKKTVSTARNWKKRNSGTDLQLPSGEVCRVKRPPMDKILSSGVIPDSLTPIAMESIKKAESGGRPVDDKDLDNQILAKMMEDENAIAELFLSFDRVTAMCVISPPVRLHMYTEQDVLEGVVAKNLVGKDIPEEDRDEDTLYTDEVDMEDKQFIFDWVMGGLAELKSFPEQPGQGVEDLSSGQNLEVPA